MVVDGSKGITRSGPLPGKTDGDAPAPSTKPGQSPLIAKKLTRKAMLFWLPWQNLLQGGSRRKTEQTVSSPQSMEHPIAKEAERLKLKGIAALSEKAETRNLQQDGKQPAIRAPEKPQTTFAVWLGAQMQNLSDEISPAYLAECIRKAGFIVGVAGLLWYDREKKRPGSLPVSLFLHVVLLVAFAWFLTHTP